MNEVKTLTRQTENAYGWMHKLLDSIPMKKWETTPKVIESNISWQVGHQIISLYYHSILVIRGHQPDVMEKVPLKEYSNHYTFRIPPKEIIDKKKPEELIHHLSIVEMKSIEIIKSITPEDLLSELEPTQIIHPVAKNKFEALDWNIKHTMWHCGQLAILKRVVDSRFDFKIQKVE